MKKMLRLGVMVMVVVLMAAANSQAARIKDIAGIVGVRDNQLVGYGLVVGLMGTGDNVQNTGFGRETISNMLSRHGLSMKDRIALVKTKNSASVMVTATLPAFARNGSKIDCQVSSMGDASSLQGGTLIMTPLRAPDGDIYAVCQGGLFIGGFFGGRGECLRHQEPDKCGGCAERCLCGEGSPLRFIQHQSPDHQSLQSGLHDVKADGRKA